MIIVVELLRALATLWIAFIVIAVVCISIYTVVRLLLRELD